MKYGQLSDRFSDKDLSRMFFDTRSISARPITPEEAASLICEVIDRRAAEKEALMYGVSQGDFSSYQKSAARTLGSDSLAMAALGLTGEAGEFADEVKKILYHGKPQNTEALEKELGDVLWYVAAAATVLGLDLAEIAAKNIEKLKTRYPDGFSAEASALRADVETAK